MSSAGVFIRGPHCLVCSILDSHSELCLCIIPQHSRQLKSQLVLIGSEKNELFLSGLCALKNKPQFVNFKDSEMIKTVFVFLLRKYCSKQEMPILYYSTQSIFSHSRFQTFVWKQWLVLVAKPIKEESRFLNKMLFPKGECKQFA